ncbi:DUF368 domain-containing protein [Lacticaseibacillus hegangensis]|uniref:DUF368 domain-containing protein n=1 Tax=Lacticaseibacillus hegangensis TaxID=2486010 RepID=A0ABW4CUN4_9LACO|nr:DUF368 domain-containing protein [Lacticaseibacillus hegangensis]
MLNAIKGALIGIALVIPGLSGSIFAVVVGLYDRLLKAVNHFKEAPKQHAKLLVPVGLGAVVGVLLSTRAVLVLTNTWPLASYGFFIGLVLGIGPFVWRKLRQVTFRPWYLLLPVLGFAVIYGLAQVGGEKPENLIALTRLNGLGDGLTMAFAGVFAVALMAIPGISGSIMLMVINQYGTVYNAVAALGPSLSALLAGDWAKLAVRLQTVLLLVPFMMGAVVGLLIIAKIMEALLARYEGQVYYAVIGIVLAAVLILIQTGLQPYWPANGGLAAAATVLVSIVFGVLATMFLDRPAGK